jgi:thiol-disulfide isomerase/thioredoxin
MQNSPNTLNSNYIYIAIVAVLLLGAAVVFFQSSDTSSLTQPAQSEQATLSETSNTTTNDALSETSNTTTNKAITKTEDSQAQILQPYQVYSPEALQAAQETDNKIVLFFHATWCPSCRALDSEITSNLAEIPENLTIFKVNYDAETALKQQYSVTTQHTLVQIDSTGNEVTKWSGGSRIKQLLNQVQN